MHGQVGSQRCGRMKGHTVSSLVQESEPGKGKEGGNPRKDESLRTWGNRCLVFSTSACKQHALCIQLQHLSGAVV